METNHQEVCKSRPIIRGLDNRDQSEWGLQIKTANQKECLQNQTNQIGMCKQLQHIMTNKAR